MIRTVPIPSDKLEQVVSELRWLGNSIAEKGGKVVVDYAKGTVVLDGISMKITGNDPYTIIIEGENSKADDIEYLAKDFRRFE